MLMATAGWPRAQVSMLSGETRPPFETHVFQTLDVAQKPVRFRRQSSFVATLVKNNGCGIELQGQFLEIAPLPNRSGLTARFGSAEVFRMLVQETRLCS